MNNINKNYKIVWLLLLFTLSACGPDPSAKTSSQAITVPEFHFQPLGSLGFLKEQHDKLFAKLKTLPMYQAIGTQALKSDKAGVDFELFNPFSDAIARNNLAEVKKLLSHAPYLVNREIFYPGKSTADLIFPLIYAVKENQKPLFDALVAQDASDLDISDKKSTPLAEAFWLTKIDLDAGKYFMGELLAKGVDPLLKLDDGTWLHDQPELKSPSLKDIGDRIAEVIDVNFSKEPYKVGSETLEYKPRLIKAVQNCDWPGFNMLFENKFSIKSSKLINDTIHAASKTEKCNKQTDIIQVLINRAIFPGRWQLILTNSWPHLFKAKKPIPDVADEYYYRSINSTVMELKFETELYNKFSMPEGQIGETMYKFLDDAFKILATKIDSSSHISPKLVSFLSDRNNAQKVTNSLDFSRELLSWKDQSTIAKKIHDYSQIAPAVIPAGWVKHGFSIVVFKNMLIKANKGERSAGIISGARIYSFANSPANLEYLVPLISFGNKGRLPTVEGKKLFDHDIDGQMGLVFKKQIEEPDQCVGNCAWESDASFGLQLLIAILLTDDWQTKDTDQLIDALAYEQGKRITEEIKRYSTYYLVDKYLGHTMDTLGQNRCLPETHMLALIVDRELARGASFLGGNQLSFYGKKIVSRILESGWHLPGLRKSLDYENKNNRPKLLLLLNHLGINSRTFDNEARIAAESLFLLFDPPKIKPGAIIYGPGRCY